MIAINVEKAVYRGCEDCATTLTQKAARGGSLMMCEVPVWLVGMKAQRCATQRDPILGRVRVGKFTAQLRAAGCETQM